MKTIAYTTLVLFCFLLLTTTKVMAQKKMPKDAIDIKVEALLKKMTLAEKVGQMNQYSGFWEFTGPTPKAGNAKEKYDHLKQGLVGSILNVIGVEKIRKMQEIAVNESRLGIPLMFGFDIIHGHKTLFPIPLAEAASWDLDAMELSARTAATEASAMGINWTFAPMMDISRDARWGRVMEGGGEDPYLGAKIAAARVKGFQGTDLTANNTIAATAKHFAAYGFSEAGREYNTVDVSTSTLYNVVLPPFKAAVDANVKTVMNSFNILNGIPATGNAFLQRDILKGKWNFKGFVISDWGSAGELVNHGYAKDLKEAAQFAANAGSDVDMESYAYVTHLKSLVESGKVDIKVVNEAVSRILRVKFELGLFDDPYRYCNEQREKEIVFSASSKEKALEVAKKSIVLLKNDNALLPLKTTQNNIAVIGTLANDKTSPLGSWRIGSDDNTAISVVEGIKGYSNNFKYEKGVTLVKGAANFIQELKINETDTTGFAAAIEVAKSSEVVIMVLGEHGFQSGEGRSRTKIDLPGLQQQLLEAVYAVNKNIVLVLMNGRPLAIPWAAKNIPAIVEAWQLGTMSGQAIADVLFGAYNPGGKLPMSFPRSVGQVPIYYNQFNTGRSVIRQDVFWSHYSDESNQPLFPFGFGLSYTGFDYTNLKINKNKVGNIEVQVTVTNTGNRAGEEIVQLYLHDVYASNVRPSKELKGFKKINIEAGQSTEVQFILTDAELGFYMSDGKFVVEPGDFEIMVGGSSDKGLKGKFVK